MDKIKKAQERAKIKQYARGNHPIDTKATPTVNADFTRPLTGVRYRNRLHTMLKEGVKWDGNEWLDSQQTH